MLKYETNLGCQINFPKEKKNREKARRCRYCTGNYRIERIAAQMWERGN